MMKISLLIITFFTAIIFSIAQEAEERVPGELLVMLKGGYNPNDNAILKANLESLGIKVDVKLGHSFNIWLFKFDESKSIPGKVLNLIRQHPAVELAQFNHPVTEREVIPNDPSFSVQWSLKNTGQSGGYPGADIHATLAWDLTTNGVTALGDTIVIAVVDGGVDLTHSDLNLQKNYNEIPLNGIDDDNNGYIDDYNGWNAYNSTGNLVPHDHGTHVIGIAGAKTNNGIGVSGVSYGARVMPVAGSSTTESTVVRAYDYVYTMRKTYNESNGEAGHYIVVSNSSFGVDAANPDNYPLWGAMYDSMGLAGIINVASTANKSWDVDIKGDVPTAMTNESIVAVTNSTNLDLLSTQAAWGYNSIDLAAPGTSIFSTLQGNLYGYKTGTSMSSPMVSGSIALMYAVADSASLLEYKAFPSLGVSKFKRYLIATVDTIPTLIGKTVSGGRLNTFDAVSMALNPPLLSSNPDSLVVSLKPNALDTIVIELISTSTELNPYTVTLPPDTAWISTDVNSGTFTPGYNEFLKLYFNTSDLPVGIYTCNISVNDYFLNQLVIPVTLKVDTSSDVRNLSSNAYLSVSPNPFEDQLRINVSLLHASDVYVNVYNTQGLKVATLFEGNMQAGGHTLVWDGTRENNQNVPAGVYLIVITDRFGLKTVKAIKK